MRRFGDLDRSVQVRAPAVAAALEPFGQGGEEQGDHLARIVAVCLGARANAVQPSRARIAEPGDHEVILGREMAIERRLGDIGCLDERVDARCLSPRFVEQPRSGFEDPVPSRRPRGTAARPEDTADDGDRVDGQDIDDRARAVAIEIVRADDDIRSPPDELVDAGLVFDQLGRVIGLERPAHVPDQPRPRITERRPGLQDLSQVGELDRAIEPPAAQVRLRPRDNLELLRVDRSRDVDAARGQAVEMRLAGDGIDEVDRAIAVLETIQDERHQKVVGVVGPVDECAEMPMVAEILACEPDVAWHRTHDQVGPSSNRVALPGDVGAHGIAEPGRCIETVLSSDRQVCITNRTIGVTERCPGQGIPERQTRDESAHDIRSHPGRRDQRSLPA